MQNTIHKIPSHAAVRNFPLITAISLSSIFLFVLQEINDRLFLHHVINVLYLYVRMLLALCSCGFALVAHHAHFNPANGFPQNWSLYYFKIRKTIRKVVVLYLVRYPKYKCTFFNES